MFIGADDCKGSAENQPTTTSVVTGLVDCARVDVSGNGGKTPEDEHREGLPPKGVGLERWNTPSGAEKSPGLGEAPRGYKNLSNNKPKEVTGRPIPETERSGNGLSHGEKPRGRGRHENQRDEDSSLLKSKSYQEREVQRRGGNGRGDAVLL